MIPKILLRVDGGPTLKKKGNRFSGKADFSFIRHRISKAWERDLEGRFRYGSQHGGMNVTKILRECGE